MCTQGQLPVGVGLLQDIGLRVYFAKVDFHSTRLPEPSTMEEP